MYWQQRITWRTIILLSSLLWLSSLATPDSLSVMDKLDLENNCFTKHSRPLDAIVLFLFLQTSLSSDPDITGNSSELYERLLQRVGPGVLLLHLLAVTLETDADHLSGLLPHLREGLKKNQKSVEFSTPGLTPPPVVKCGTKILFVIF